jgi:hypothetical protein
MTETEVQLSQLQKSIVHLAGFSEDGWVMQWGNSPETMFEIVCRKANALQVEKLDSLISEGHRKAAAVRK